MPNLSAAAVCAAISGVIWSVQPGPLAINFVLCALGFFGTVAYIPAVKDLFIAAGCSGKDLNKVSQPVMYVRTQYASHSVVGVQFHGMRQQFPFPHSEAISANDFADQKVLESSSARRI
jgi:hypothetical protein